MCWATCRLFMAKDEIYIKHILDAISAVEKFTRQVDHKSFLENELVQAGVIRELEIIGEATKNISSNFKKSHKEIPWKDAAGMRDKLIHFYFGVDLEIVWQTIKEKLPQLKKVLLQLN